MNKDTFVERVVGILSSRLEEGLVKAQNKAMKKSWEAQQGKQKVAAKVGVTPRETQAAKKGGKGGGADAMKRGVQASYRAAHRQDASTDPKVNFINRTVDNLVERLVGKQKKLDVNKSGKLDAQDFKMLRKGKRKDEEHGLSPEDKAGNTKLARAGAIAKIKDLKKQGRGMAAQDVAKGHSQEVTGKKPKLP